MTNNEYLKHILKQQDLDDKGPEIKALDDRRAQVTAIMRKAFPGLSLSIRAVGSRAKGTLIKACYDQDLPCFLYPGEAAHIPLDEIYDISRVALGEDFYVEQKTSALRLKSKDPKQRVDLRTDVVPGRIIDEKTGDAFLYFSGFEKNRIKTNLDTHISHVRDSGFTSEIRLIKLVNFHFSVQVRTFPLELAAIELLKAARANEGLAGNFVVLLERLKRDADKVVIKDPANPEGNDLSKIFDSSVRSRLASISDRVLQMINDRGFESVFGAFDEKPAAVNVGIISQFAPTVRNPARPYAK